jgi:hypothetical protein
MDAQRLSVTATGAGAGPNRGHMPGLRPASDPASPAVGRRRFPGPALTVARAPGTCRAEAPLGGPPRSPRHPVAAALRGRRCGRGALRRRAGRRSVRRRAGPQTGGPYRAAEDYGGPPGVYGGVRYGDGDDGAYRAAGPCRDAGSCAGRDPYGDGQRGDGDPCRDRGPYSRGRSGGGHDGGRRPPFPAGPAFRFAGCRLPTRVFSLRAVPRRACSQRGGSDAKKRACNINPSGFTPPIHSGTSAETPTAESTWQESERVVV